MSEKDYNESMDILTGNSRPVTPPPRKRSR
jgi:hypothetical protein